MFAIPGNHDWYDGLTNFFREFCQGGFLGGWQLFQRRSYFAVKLTKGWWLWGIDIALDTRIDSPQQAYFLKILQDSAPEQHPTQDKADVGGDKALAELRGPTARNSKQETGSFCARPNLRGSRFPATRTKRIGIWWYFVEKIVNDHDGTVPVILTGDLHHYNRYASKGGYQMIVSGGGGAYLMGTHFLPDRIPQLDPRLRFDLDPDMTAGLKSSASRAEQRVRREQLPLSQPRRLPPPRARRALAGGSSRELVVLSGDRRRLLVSRRGRSSVAFAIDRAIAGTLVRELPAPAALALEQSRDDQFCPGGRRDVFLRALCHRRQRSSIAVFDRDLGSDSWRDSRLAGGHSGVASRGIPARSIAR